MGDGLDLDKELRDQLMSLQTQDILDHLPKITEIDIFEYIEAYLDEYRTVYENISGVFINTASNINFCGMQEYKHDRDIYDEIQMTYGASIWANKFMTNVRLAISQMRNFQGTIHTSKSMWSMFERGMEHKLWKMNELASKLSEPLVLNPMAVVNKLETKTTIDSFLDDLLPYSFYVEAKVTCSCKIILYLNQVIETRVSEQTTEKSTLLIDESTIEVGDIYESICENLWNSLVDESFIRCELHATSTTKSMAHYKKFCLNLTSRFQKSFANRVMQQDDIDDVFTVQINETGCGCAVSSSYRKMLNLGVDPYLSSVARSIVSHVHSNVLSGKYHILRLLVSGSMLIKWAALYNSAHSDYFWKQFEREIGLFLYEKQLKIHLVISKSDVLQDYFPDNCSLARQKFRQVSSRNMFLEIEGIGGPEAEMYEFKHDRYERVPRVNGHEQMWRACIVSTEEDILDLTGIEKRFYIHFNDSDLNEEYARYSTYSAAIVLTQFPINEEILTDASFVTPNENIVIDYLLRFSSALHSFSVFVNIKPLPRLSQLGIYFSENIRADSRTPLFTRQSLISERLTLIQA
ncbi:hypothetical protein [Parasitella parasitica]|uniref:Uncharacterized protein n=1 Tax=Parasitella parasitica TaxID=35722 RepID=A0A0B7NXT3_9FUNG|nr:hypothetical protein [Parasitella parasitica]